MLKTKMWKHRLTNIDLENKTADCSNCGFVKIRKSPAMTHPRCWGYINAQRLKVYGPTTPKAKKCEVCGSSKRIVLDHNHKTSLFRGWLCNACNVALGLLQDDPERCRALAKYLESQE